jgi:hypothetical protein
LHPTSFQLQLAPQVLLSLVGFFLLITVLFILIFNGLMV